MLRRLLALGAAVLLLIWWLRRERARRRTPGRAASPAGRMVRDRICNTYLPESRALTVERDGTSHHFCSEACRRRFLERPAG